MDVILHIGAHRTATTTFQHYMRGQANDLARTGVAFWGPARTRTGLFHGMFAGGCVLEQDRRRVVGRVALNMTKAREQGRRSLIVSDENLAGNVRENLRRGALYPTIGTRLERVDEVFAGRVTQVVLTIRSLDLYWASALGYGLTRGRRVPDIAACDRLVTTPRSWRDVITDIACAMPQARVRVLPFETLGGRPDALLSQITGLPAPADPEDRRLNATPKLPGLREIAGPEGLPEGDGRWQPFDNAQASALREVYQDDLFWLSSGADDLAELMAYGPKPKAGATPPQTGFTRGSSDDSQQRRMAQTRRE